MIQELRRGFGGQRERQTGSEAEDDIRHCNDPRCDEQCSRHFLARLAVIGVADDEALTGAWDHAAGEWVELGSEHRNPIRQAIRMARNQIAPDLLLLPTIPPEAP